jgi:sulfite oxidase
MMRYGKHPKFVVHQDEPFNGGSPSDILRETFTTPTSAFYVRAHAPVPEIQVDEYRLTVNGLVSKTLTLTLNDLKQRYPKTTVMATLQCAGNRRTEMAEVAPMPGESVMWGTEAISNATWSGVALRDILAEAGVQNGTAHVAFVSYDQVEKGSETFGYGGSIPIDKALRSEVLLAYEMNGEPLPPVHGFPLRMVVPGYVAARSVKWLCTITLQPEPSDNFYQQRDYKVFPPDINEDNVDWSQGEMLGEMRTDSVICIPCDRERIAAGKVTVKGYAIPGGDAEITRVEISSDDGATWVEAALLGESLKWAWRFWEATLELPTGQHTLLARVYDTQGSTQAQSAAELWNFKGYMNNSQHRITVQVE